MVTDAAIGGSTGKDEGRSAQKAGLNTMDQTKSRYFFHSLS